MKLISIIIITLLILPSIVQGNNFDTIDKNIKISVKQTTLQFSKNTVKIINQNKENTEMFVNNELKNLEILIKKMVNFVKETKNKKIIIPEIKNQIEKYKKLAQIRIKSSFDKIDYSQKEYFKIINMHPELNSNPKKTKSEYVKELINKKDNTFIKYAPDAKNKIENEWKEVFNKLNELREKYNTETN